MNMVGRLLRALAALIVLVAVLVGAPIALWVLGRGLLPTGVPSPGEVWEGLTSRDTGGVFLGLLVVIGFIAWAVFTVCVVLEIAALLTGRRRAWRIPLLRVPQSAATALISVILTGTVMLGGASAAAARAPAPDLHQSLSAGTASAAAAEVPTVRGPAAAPGPAPTPPPAAAAAAQAPAAGPVWTVARYDTFWGIAAATLGDGRRFSEIVDLNVGVVQADGSTVRDATTDLQIGWRLRLPAGANAPAAPAAPAASVTVTAGDTLSGIAAEELGDATRYPELAAANQIPDPDVITPGEVILIPASTTVAPPPPGTLEMPTTTPDGGQNQAPTPADPADPPAVGQTGTGADQAPAGVAAASAATTGPSPAPASSPAAGTFAVSPPGGGQNQSPGPGVATPAPSQASAPPGPGSATSAPAAAGQGDRSSVAPAVVGMGMSAVLAGAVWLGLLAVRRRKGRRRPTGLEPVPVSLQAARMERRIRERAADVMWMDRALRHAATLVTDAAGDLPDVTCVWLSDQELQLQLATPAPAPPPFTAEGDSWVLPVGTDLPAAQGESADPAAPFPLLSSVGHRGNDTLLVDLERLGAITLTGDAERTRQLLTHLAVELAHNAWSDYLQVTLVGWGAELVALNPERVRHLPTVGEVTTLVRGRLQDTRETLQDLGSTVLADRIIDDGTGDWEPQVWLIDAVTADSDLHALEEALAGVAADGRATVAVIARAAAFAPAGGAVIDVDKDGFLSIPVLLGDQRVQAAGLDPEAAAGLLDQFESAGRFQRPGPMPGPEPWARGMTTAGSLIPEALLTVADPDHTEVQVDDGDPAAAAAAGGGQKPGGVGDDPAELAVDEPPAAADGGGQEPGRVVPFRVGPPAAADTVLAVTVAADSGLDDDLEEWFCATPRRPRVGVLGPPLVAANGPTPTVRLARITEMAVYLGTHREVDADTLLTDLWPEDTTVKAVSRRSEVSRVRAWLGVDEDGRKYLPEARSKPYRLTRLLDLDLFRRLRKRADARAGAADKAGAQRDLLAALMLVRGPVMAQTPRDTYAWLATSDPAGVRQASLMVIAAAHALVELALDDGDPADGGLELARIAADVGHRVDPVDDVPLRDLLWIAHRAGDDRTALMWAWQLLAANGVDVPADLPDYESYRVVDEVFPNGLRAAAAASG